MFKYTQACIDKIVTDVKNLVFISNIVSQVFAILYPLFALLTHRGFWVFNLILLTISIAYSVFFICTQQSEISKTAKKTVARIHKYSKMTVKFFNLCLLIYGLWQTADNVSPLSLILTVLMAIVFLADVLLEIAKVIVERYKDFLLDCVRQDVEDIKKPVVTVKNTVGNLFKRITGQPVEEPPLPTPAEQKKLDKMNKMVSDWEVRKQKKALKKQEAKEQAKQKKRKEQFKEQKAQEKADKQQAKKDKKSA